MSEKFSVFETIPERSAVKARVLDSRYMKIAMESNCHSVCAFLLVAVAGSIGTGYVAEGIRGRGERDEKKDSTPEKRPFRSHVAPKSRGSSAFAKRLYLDARHSILDIHMRMVRLPRKRNQTGC